MRDTLRVKQGGAAQEEEEGENNMDLGSIIRSSHRFPAPPPQPGYEVFFLKMPVGVRCSRVCGRKELTGCKNRRVTKPRE